MIDVALQQAICIKRKKQIINEEQYLFYLVVNFLRLQLYITKSYDTTILSRKRFYFAIIDLDRNYDYPTNFVCILPSNLNIKNDNSTLSVIFRENRIQIAKQILLDTLSKENSEIKFSAR